MNNPDAPTVDQANSTQPELDDESLLDLGGGAAILMGVRSYQNGNPGRGAQLITAGLAAIGGRRVLRDYFQN